MKLALVAFFLLSVSVLGAKYSDPRHGFSFEFNSALWAQTDKVAQPQNGMALAGHATLVAIQRKVADDRYHARFSVVIEDTTALEGKGDLLTAYFNRSVKFLRNQRFHILKKGKAPLPKLGLPAFEVMAVQRDFGLTFRQVMFVRNRRAYLLSAAARTKNFADYEAEIENLFFTFTLDSPQSSKK